MRSGYSNENTKEFPEEMESPRIFPIEDQYLIESNLLSFYLLQVKLVKLKKKPPEHTSVPKSVPEPAPEPALKPLAVVSNPIQVPEPVREPALEPLPIVSNPIRAEYPIGDFIRRHCPNSPITMLQLHRLAEKMGETNFKEIMDEVLVDSRLFDEIFHSRTCVSFTKGNLYPFFKAYSRRIEETFQQHQEGIYQEYPLVKRKPIEAKTTPVDHPFVFVPAGTVATIRDLFTQETKDFPPVPTGTVALVKKILKEEVKASDAELRIVAVESTAHPTTATSGTGATVATTLQPVTTITPEAKVVVAIDPSAHSTATTPDTVAAVATTSQPVTTIIPEAKAVVDTDGFVDVNYDDVLPNLPHDAPQQASNDFVNVTHDDIPQDDATRQASSNASSTGFFGRVYDAFASVISTSVQNDNAPRPG